MDEELDRFKQIDLRSYARSVGYSLDPRDKSAMHHAGGDKIIISRKPDGHFTYWSVRDDRDKGTIIDFIARRRGFNLGQVRKELRGWTATSSIVATPLPELPVTVRDHDLVRRRYSAMAVALRHDYLEQERGIPREVLQSRRFNGCVKIDRHGNAVFAHYDLDGVCGFELRNAGFKGFSTGGTKGLFLSNAMPDDERLVFCESGIEALSHCALYSHAAARYASVGGKLSAIQSDLICSAVLRMPKGAEIIAAMNADIAGRKLANEVGLAVEISGRNDLSFHSEEPIDFKDWNVQLCSRPKIPSSQHPVPPRSRDP